jgi:hypothetical protein
MQGYKPSWAGNKERKRKKIEHDEKDGVRSRSRSAECEVSL